MMASLCLPSTQARTGHGVMLVGSREDWDKYLRECLCKVPLGMRTLAPLTLIVIKMIIELPVDSRVPAPKKGQTIPTIKGFTSLILSLPRIAESSQGFV